MSTELAIRPDQTSFDEKQLAALRSIGVQNAPPADVALFFHQAARTGLDPFLRQIYLINRGGKWGIQTAIDGFRLIRDRKGTYQGHDEEWCGPDGVWRDVWLDPNVPPAAARVSVFVKGYQRPVVGIALWTEYAQIGRDNKPQSVWASKPALMLAKCAEALALCKAYPQDLSGLYTSDELPEAEQGADGVHVVTTMQEDVRKPPARRPSPTAQPVRSHGEVFTEWYVIVRNTYDMDALIRAHDDAVKRGVLDIRNDEVGQSIEDVFLARREQLQQPEVHLSAETADYDEETLPF
jgi:phage recombination protein Bet